MTTSPIRELLGPLGRQALADAMAEPEPGSLAAATRLRKRYSPELAAAALSQAVLRAKAATKHPRAAELLWTPAGLEQATRYPVARWRAARFAAAGVKQVWDLGCGVGADALAFAELGIEVVAIEADEHTAAAAEHNLGLVGGAEVRVGLVEQAEPPADAAVFLDPARRTGRGRTWRPEDFSPPWQLVADYLASDRFVSVKAGPGLPKELIPAEVRATWVSHARDAVEVSLWNRLPAGPEAVVLADEGAQSLPSPERLRELPVRPVGHYVIEPDNAVIRAGLLSEIAPETDLWLLDPQVAYLSSNQPYQGPWGTCFEVLQVLDYREKTLAAWVRAGDIGALEIKKRAIDVDPAQLRKRLNPRGTQSATLLLARTGQGTKALVVRPLGR